MNICKSLCELQSEELFEGRSSQLYTQLMQLRKESLQKNSGSYGIQTLDLCDTSVVPCQIFQAFPSFPGLHVA